MLHVMLVQGPRVATPARRPRPKPQPLDILCIGGFLVSLAYPLALTPLEPWLLGTHPVLVATFLGTVESLVTAGAFARVGRAALWVVLLAPVVCGDLLDPFSWWVGQRYGKHILEMAKGADRYRAAAERADRFFRRWGGWALVLAYYLPIPNALVYIAAGESGMSLQAFIALDLAGTALGLMPLVMLGFIIGQGAVDLAGLITHYAGISAIVLVVVIVGWNMWRGRRARRG